MKHDLELLLDQDFDTSGTESVDMLTRRILATGRIS
jgi:hypothetical protein